MTEGVPGEPLASGSLVETPFVHLMLYLYRQSGAGTLHVRGESGETLVRVRQGRPVAARASGGSGDLMHALLPVCGWRSGQFAFYAGDAIEALAHGGALESERTVTGSLDPYALLYASIRDHARDDMVQSVLARYPNDVLTVPVDRDIGRLGMSDADRMFAEGLRRAPATIAAAIIGTDLPEQHAQRLLYALLVTHMLTPDEGRSSDLYKSQIGMEAPPVAQNAGAITSTTDAAVKPRPSTPPKPMEIPVSGSVNDVASAARPAWQQLMSMRVAASVESSAKGNAAIPSLRPPSALRGSMANASNDPATRKRRVDQLMQGGRFAEALALLDGLLESEATNAKLHGLRARALFEVHRSDTDGVPRTVVEAIKRAHELDPDEPNAYLARGLVFKQAGDQQKAATCWKRALQSDPNNIEAQRELRLIKLRG